MKSLSEIETTVKRASKAAGYSWGVSEETGKSIRLLELFSLPGIKHLNEYFNEKNKSKFENLNLISENNSSFNKPYCPITLGVSFLDQINALEHLKKIEFKNVAYPIIFVSFISRSSEIIGKKIYVKIDEKKIFLNLNVNIISNFIDQEFPKIANSIEVNLFENEDNFTNDEWNNLYKLSEQTFVEESDSLKEGAAGAGLTDND
ncbi:DUF3726 domain-containing protein [Candidatus Pelagibacter sp.]|nr:DUF3726 domain-containing protein [Candidatus Pelagibacter sp.]